MSMYRYRATCERVVDGDTLDLLIDCGFRINFRDRFRLLGIDAPETFGVPKDSPEYLAGVKARDRLVELVTGDQLVVETHRDSRDKYGRYLAVVWTSAPLNVATVLLNEGLVSAA